jgi:RHS repeat-associated protein
VQRLQTTGQGLPLTTWIQEPGAFTPLAKIQGRKRYGIVSDHLGTPTFLATEAGKIAWHAQLDIYGVPREQPALVDKNEQTDNPWRFPGQYEDAETGLYYNRYRYYDPELGRYLSEDPIGLLGGEALYGYVHEPLGWWDPLGLACKKKKRREPTGSYTLLFGSGKRYHGKGPRKRSESSGRRLQKKWGDRHVATDWKPASSRREAFKEESRRLDADGGPGKGKTRNYNEIEQPGKRYRKEDGEIP